MRAHEHARTLDPETPIPMLWVGLAQLAHPSNWVFGIGHREQQIGLNGQISSTRVRTGGHRRQLMDQSLPLFLMSFDLGATGAQGS